MKLAIILGSAALIMLGPGHARPSPGSSKRLFTCSFGATRVSVTAADGRLVYHYGTAKKDRMTIAGSAATKNLFWLWQRFAGPEYQLRFTNGEYSYIVYTSEGNGRVGAASTSGLVVMRGAQRISDKSCSRYEELVMPDDDLGLPEDTDAYSAM